MRDVCSPLTLSLSPLSLRLSFVSHRAPVKYICIHRRSTSGSRKIVMHALQCVCPCVRVQYACSVLFRPLPPRLVASISCVRANLPSMLKHFSAFIQHFYYYFPLFLTILFRSFAGRYFFFIQFSNLLYSTREA